MDIDTALDRLYAASRDEFIPLRDELVKQARADGDRELAGLIGAARKPTVAAWLINQVGHEYPDDIAALAELADALRSAHEQLAGDRLRELSRQRNELLRTLDDRAFRIARRASTGLTDQVTDQLRGAFMAALQDKDVLDEIRKGQLPAAPTTAADTGWPSFPGAVLKPAKPAKSEKSETSEKPATVAKPVRPVEPPKPDERQRAREQARQEAKKAADAAEAQRAETERALVAAKAALTEAEDELVAARERVETARAEQRAAKQVAALAQHDYEVAQRAARAAANSLADLE